MNNFLKFALICLFYSKVLFSMDSIVEATLNANLNIAAILQLLKPDNNNSEHNITQQSSVTDICMSSEGESKTSNKSREPLFRCEYPNCGFETHTLRNLKAHDNRRHKKIKNYDCEQCNKSFYSKSELNSHKLVHSDDLPFGCPHCSHRCNKNHNLARHILYMHFFCLRCETKHKTRKSALKCDRSHPRIK